MEAKKVLFISQEVAPYLPETPMAILGRDVPQGIHGKEFEVRSFTPKYGCINERRNQLHEVIRLSGMNLIIDDSDHPLIIKVATLLPSRMQVYFIDNDDYFQPLPEKGLETDLLAADNDERIMFFTMGVIETVKKLRWQPAVIHCSGWVSALAPLYLRRKYNDDPTFRNSKIVFALHPEKFDGTLDARFVEKLLMSEFSEEDIAALGGEPVDFIKLNELAMDYADAIIQVTDDVDSGLVEYAAASGKPFLPYNASDDRSAQYTQFYRSLMEE
ncbi:MAG: glycogen/starch synthase [Duncaniella sp.]|nr:glycogen/starch synthase [Duncaniella sp.]MDE7144795.1 glycogen/starch synthase [Duncaniella sp.]